MAKNMLKRYMPKSLSQAFKVWKDSFYNHTISYNLHIHNLDK